ncbi:M35 family metallo-endopeptidase [Paraburkholderia terrae]|uniref:M35 family metallo-endopeptidase n=1 Tax=Paraburkholderia terrae TaxID=311230 RepID=UPI00296AD04C|nr:M35 family metallo-endopeptidase [Paraburkholderia terrae]MDW3660588.1 M35 family metallo-endopeptidase [Paraburkholderia terrae]
MSDLLRKLCAVFLLVGSCAAPAAPIACDAQQAAIAAAANTKARDMLQKVVSLMDAGDSIAIDRLGLWLGVVNSGQQQAVKDRLNKAWAFLGGTTFLCDTANPDYAWVYKEQPFTVRLGSAFFSAGTTGYSSQGGTLVHETTHFLINGASADPPERKLYGTKAALDRAKSSPAQAQQNAENLEYFVEATFFGMDPP